jgi:RNA-directed DNA polymerase
MESGVGQLAFTFAFPEGETKDEAEETQDNGSEASSQSASARSKSERKQKWHSLIDKVYAPRNLQSAWERVRANQGAPGVDGITIARFEEHAPARLQQLSQELRAKTYRPQPVRRVFIPKSGGGQRPLGIPTVRDRIVQQALLQVLEPIFEAQFSARSHGFRPGRGCATALDVADRAVRFGYGWVVDADLQSFFDTVDHERLLAALNEEVADGSVLRLIRRILQAGVSLPGTAELEPTELGTPQGGPLSPLLANVYLHAFDQQLAAAGYGLLRYADDFVIFAHSEGEARAALKLAQEILEGQLGLRLHPEKTRVTTAASGFEFLGFHYYCDPQDGTWRKEVRRKSVQRFRETVRRHTPRLKNQRLPRVRHLTLVRLRKNQRLQETLRALNAFLRGWHGYFYGVWSPYATPFRYFDSFVRRRLRAAISGRRGEGWWNKRLPNALLRDLGLLSLDALQQEYRGGPRRPLVRKDQPGGEPYAGKPHVRFGKAGGRATSP